jgi:hypothetical protein
MTTQKALNAAYAPRTLRGAARDFFRYGSPRLLAAQLVVAVVARPFIGSVGPADVLVVAGVAAYWPLQEWAMHRYLLHAKSDVSWVRAHHKHHEDVFDQKLTLLPTSMIALLVPIHVALWLVLVPRTSLAVTGIAALGGAALLYEWIHFLTHTAYRPRSAWFREVRTRHMWHHQRDAQRWFGFVVPRLDDLLGTGGR